MSWRLAYSLSTLQNEVNASYPNRPRAADGTIGDAAHQAEVSDHNPNGHGVVTAWDITTADFTDQMAEWLRNLGRNGDRRVKYVIYKTRITSAEHGWFWASYSGADPHTSHIHLSVSADPAQYDRTDAWHFTTHTEDTDMTPAQAAQLDRIEKKLDALTAPRRPDHKDTDPNTTSLGDVLTDVENTSGK